MTDHERASTRSAGKVHPARSSNQPPDAPPESDAAARKLITGFNREWLVVVENPTLEKIFESYIDYDFQQSEGFRL